MFSTGAGTTNPDAVADSFTVEHTPVPVTYAVFDTAVAAHTTPTCPLIVNVNAFPKPRLVAALLHANTVPVPATLVTVGVGKPVGSLAVPLITTGEIVSVTVSAVSVASPVFVTTIAYVNAFPVPGVGVVWIFTTEIPVVTAGTKAPTALLFRVACAHAIPPVAYAVFDTCVAAHTTP